MKLFVLRVVLALAGMSAFAAEVASPASARLLRYPTYHQGKVAFTYLGDIWIANDTGGEPRRLTDHRARDAFPRFSPDGSLIAFSSNRDGNYDVFVIPSAGGRARQLTFHSADDTVVGWSPDGKKILFSSARNQGVFPGIATLFTIPVEGGMEEAIATDWGTTASYSVDGSKLAFTRHAAPAARLHNRGSYVSDLWVMDTKATTFTRVAEPDYKGNYLWPMYGPGGDIYLVTDRLPGEAEKGVKFGGPAVMKSVNNLWKISDRGGKLVQVTRHTSGNLYYPSISADRKTIVYEEGFGLWKLDVASGRSTEIRITIASDMKDNDVQLRTFTAEADGLSISPSGKRAAIATHGEIFTIATGRGEVQRVTESFWRDQHPRWSPDGKFVAFVSDRSGREEIWIADEQGGKLQQVTDVDCDKAAVVWAPDSKSMLWTGSDRKLRRVILADLTTTEIVASPIGPISTPQFSPDARWISYTKLDAMLRPHVYVKPVKDGEERRVEGEDFILSQGAKWTPDGKKLLLLGGVGVPGMASLARTTTQLYSVALTIIDKNPDDRDVDSEEQATAPPPRTGSAGRSSAPASTANSGTATTAGASPAPSTVSAETLRTAVAAAAAQARVQVKIEWEAIERRMKKLTSVSGSVTSVVPSYDSRTYAFVATGAEEDETTPAGPTLNTIGDDGTRLTRISQPAVTTADPSDAPRTRTGTGPSLLDPQWSKDSRTLYYIQRGGIYAASVSAPSTPDSTGGGTSLSDMLNRTLGSRASGSTTTTTTSLSLPRRITFSARMEVDLTAERRQVFQEAWRVMRNRFYDPAMHGVDWDAVRRKYEALLAHVSDTDELQLLLAFMIGELNASHTGVSGGDRPGAGERITTRYPGFELQADGSGFYKISHVYKKGPADHDYIRLAPGNFILAVNGKALTTADNYWRHFNVLSGRKLTFLVNSTTEKEGAWTVSYEPVSATTQTNLDYERWVESRRKMVEALSEGQFGYVHIRAMDAASYRRFQRELLDRMGRKALIIDQRFNGGGGIDQELLALLNQRVKYQSWRGRDSVEVPRPVQAFYGPMCVLQNERSFSDAEMFPDGFRKLGLGKLVGVTTGGAVIGTGSYQLMDGSAIRTPASGVYTASGENMENFGVAPDVWVDNGPADFRAGRDRQIEKAVEVLRGELKTPPVQ